MSTTSATVAGGRRPKNLALILQEAFTATVRIRSMPQAVTSEEAFRQQMREALRIAAQEAQNPAGYASEDIRMAVFALVGFLDETILKSGNRTFADWPKRPLQEELFGTHLAGEVFFQNVERLLKLNDSHDLADLLEVHLLCLLLGFRGRYAALGAGELQSVIRSITERITRIRGDWGDLTNAWRLPQERIEAATDPWSRRMLIAAVVFLACTLVLFVAFKLSLTSGVNEVSTVSAQGHR